MSPHADPEQPSMPLPFAQVARHGVAPDGHESTDWIAQYLEFHQVPDGLNGHRPWDEVCASAPGRGRHQELDELRRRLHTLQQRIDALESR